MRDYGKVFTSIWASPNFRAMSEDGRTLTIYLLTCPHGTISGAFRLPDGYVCEDLQWTPERVCEGFRELFANGFANRCETTKWVWVCKFLEWNPPENPNQRKSALKQAIQVPPDCVWKQAFMRVCRQSLGLEMPENINRCETLSEPLLNQEQKQEQEEQPSVVAAKTPRATRKAPSSFLIDAGLQQWARENVPGVDIRAETEKFRDYTFSKAMTDWPGTWRNWMRKAAEDAQRRPGKHATAANGAAMVGAI